MNEFQIISKRYKSTQKKKRRIEKEKSESIRWYSEQRTAIEYCHKAQAILWKLAKISPAAKALTTSDLISKVRSGEELEYYYKGCFYG